MNTTKNITRRLALAAALAALLFFSDRPASACGAPQEVSGRIEPRTALAGVAVARGSAIVRLGDIAPGPFDRYARVNSFGYFFFEAVTPCSEYRVEPLPVPKRASGDFEFFPAQLTVYVPGDQPVTGLVFGLAVY